MRLLATALLCALLPGQQSSIERHGVTWTFDREYPVGQFANGDWWVVGPVTITRIDPQTAVVGGRTVHGSMVNPGVTGAQGYDSALYHPPEVQNLWRPELNVAPTLPAVLPAGSSLVSTISRTGASPNGQIGQLLSASVLTVLPAPALRWDFRPPYAGTDKALRWNAARLQLHLLRSVEPVAGAPTIASLLPWFERPWLSHAPGWWHQTMHPCLSMPTYYREFGTLLGDAGLLLNCNLPIEEKWPLLLGLIQIGIDHWGVLQAGMRWDLLGHSNGRKFPILFAGALTGYEPMLFAGFTYETRYFGQWHPNNSAHTWFAEDGQVFYVQETSPGVFNWGYGGYGPQHRGIAEWGNQHAANERWLGGPPGPSGDNAEWSGATANPYRVCCSAVSWVGQTLTARLMGGQAVWNQPAHFDYMDRYLARETGPAWQDAMWRRYR